MVQKGLVYYNNEEAGVLIKENGEYVFSYLPRYRRKPGARPVSITMPIRREEYRSSVLFPVFANMLSEGSNKRIQGLKWKIDEHDYFGQLLMTSHGETIGPITVKPVENGPAKD